MGSVIFLVEVLVVLTRYEPCNSELICCLRVQCIQYTDTYTYTHAAQDLHGNQNYGNETHDQIIFSSIV